MKITLPVETFAAYKKRKATAKFLQGNHPQQEGITWQLKLRLGFLCFEAFHGEMQTPDL